MCFGDFLPMRTLCDAYHEEFESQSLAFNPGPISPKAYSEFSKSDPVTSSSCRLYYISKWLDVQVFSDNDYKP